MKECKKQKKKFHLDGYMSKGHGSQLKELPLAKAGTMSNKVNKN
jgi:hypothetical protein